jgi:hypothetical protein
MPIEAPAGTLEVENAKFRASSVEATIAVGIGTDSNDAYPLQVFKETAPSIRLSEGSTISSAARLYSNNSNLYIQTGADFSSGSSGDVAFQTMGGQSTHMVIKNDGKVGVGVTNPLNSLIVKGKTTIGTGASTTNSQYHDGMLNVIGGGTRAILRLENNGSVGDPAIILGEGGVFTENTVPTIKKIAGTNNLSIMTAGNVGIGTNNPLSTLHVGNGTTPITGDASGSISLFGTGAQKSQGNKPGIYHRANIGLGLWSDALMSFQVDGVSGSPVDAMRIDRSGNVGIGLANPSQKLDVNGTIYAPGSIVQVQSLTTSSAYTTTASAINGEISATYNTGIKLSITPKKSTSKILVNFNFLLFLHDQSTANGGRCQIFRKINGANRTLVYGFPSKHDLHHYANSPSGDHNYINISFVDSPNTTSVCEYELASMLYAGNGTLYVGNAGNQPVTIQLMEIGA